jgi:tRNA-specific 2-thiouridylase
MIVSGALIAMSGGVDSSVAALLTVAQSRDCIGSMMKLFSNEDVGEDFDNTCCSSADAEDARAVAYKLGIPFYVFNFADVFKEHVIRRFIQAYQNGETPNPCIDCNRYLKFDWLLRRAKELDKEYIVTGHYAQIEAGAGSGRYILKKGADLSKDQSYVLYTMTQEQLKHTSFPLGVLTKSQVREIALEHGFANAKKHDSQDICFTRGGGYADFIRQYTDREPPKGRFIDTDGNDLGEHKGIIHYTVGQRRGLGLAAAAPLYVRSVCAGNNTVVVGPEDKLYANTLIARDINLIPTDRLDAAIKVRAKIRYKQSEQPATVWQLDHDTLRVDFDSPQRAITKGQAVVLYDGDAVVGGGTIAEIIR